jgi:DNA invertase Pin-like site-specific DNA recombinase
MTFSGKVLGRHQDRLALVYVRQSTLRQVEQHQESTRLQYALVERALQLGWPRERVEVIDDDLGRSGASSANRPGFQRLVAEVGLGHVGLVLGVEMSRLARSCRDWHQLLEICALSDTLIADTDGVYSANDFNDRLLLGLKGTMSEAELHILKARMLEGRRAKALRGELHFNLPRGYIRSRTGEIVLDSDEQVQATIRLVFDTFERCHTINGVLHALVAHDIRLPHRVRSGPAKGELEWHAPNRYTLSEMLKSPLYAGAYAYGRRRAEKPSGPCRRGSEPTVLIKDRLPAYISWETYERNLAQVTANRSAHQGIARGGMALLAGLLVCGRCGQRMAALYPNGGRFQRYNCSRLAVNYGGAVCQSLSGRALDALVAELMLQALTPAALDVSLQLTEDLELERQALHRQWKQRLERARYDVERARRQYDAVEPENRLVVRTLEQRWETALAEELRVKAEHDRFLAEQPMPLSLDERAAIERLAADIPALWSAPTTTAADRQAIARLMLERVVVTVQGESEQVVVDCHWAGGTKTQHEARRPVQCLTQLHNHAALLERLRELHAGGQRAPAIAEILNTEGWRPPKRRATYTAAMVRELLHRIGVAASARSSLADRLQDRAPDELTIRELATRLRAPSVTIHRWVTRGEVTARKVPVLTHSLWLIRVDDAELQRLRQRRSGGTRHSVNPNEV